MQYSVAHFQYRFSEEWEQYIFEQALADIGFETWDGEDAYIQTELLDKAAVNSLVDSTKGVTLLSIEACEDKNWNETWEAEHPIMELAMGVQIIPHCAFGAGYHETTSMLIDQLMELELSGKNVLDNGCGTGVLGIIAAKRGAQHVVGVDIDDKSVESTIANAQLNHVEIDARLGSEPAEGQYDLILSNIHRNILLEQMPLYARYLQPDGQLWLSGFYENDVPILIEAAQQQGLQAVSQHARNEWRMIKMRKEKV